MVLTERGRRLVPAATQLLEHADAVRRLVTGAPATVRVGTLETLVATRLPAVVARLADRRPDLRLDVVSMMRGPLLRAVTTGELTRRSCWTPAPRSASSGSTTRVAPSSSSTSGRCGCTSQQGRGTGSRRQARSHPRTWPTSPSS